MKTRESFEIIAPKAASLVESLRAFGYDLGSAVADLIDNGISAGASNIWIETQWTPSGLIFAFTDDGRGMDEDELRAAMRLGSRHPSEKRDESDLGRFGLGLKTASFSQCRCLTVHSKRAGREGLIRRWDLDHLAVSDAWEALLSPQEGAEVLTQRFQTSKAGTCVVWQKIDGLGSIEATAAKEERNRLNQELEKLEAHLSLVFHRILDQPKKFSIILNGRSLQSTDPFVIDYATQILQTHTLRDLNGEKILVEPFILPHESKLSDANGGARGGTHSDWISKQGFYIYRNDRLLVGSSWLGFPGWQKDAPHKLARIRISLSNKVDADWKIDVTKRKATPPASLRPRLKIIGQKTRERARQVYSHRGTRLTSSSLGEKQFVWEQIATQSGPKYLINRSHPLLRSLTEEISAKSARSAEEVFRLIETCVPTLLISSQNLMDDFTPPEPFQTADTGEVRRMINSAYQNLRDQGQTHRESLGLLAIWEPFSSHPALLAELEAIKDHHD